MLRGLAGRYHVSGKHTVSIFRAEVCFSPTLIYTYKSPDVTTQKTNIDIFTAV
jgi:hypothetical protein